MDPIFVYSTFYLQVLCFCKCYCLCLLYAVLALCFLLLSSRPKPCQLLLLIPSWLGMSCLLVLLFFLLLPVFESTIKYLMQMSQTWLTINFMEIGNMSLLRWWIWSLFLIVTVYDDISSSRMRGCHCWRVHWTLWEQP